MSKIHTVITDVDGSLTDGSVYMSSDGVRTRKFSTFDGEGFRILREHSISVIMISQSEAQEIVDRANWLEVPFFGGVFDKEEWAKTHLGEYRRHETAHFGNDLNDLEIMKWCAFPGCPSDAHDSVIEYCGNGADSGYVCTASGGRGAFREFAELIIIQNRASSY